MHDYLKRFLGLALAVLMVISAVPAAFATENEANTPELPNAEVKNLGIVNVGPGYEAPFGVESYYIYDLIYGGGLSSDTKSFMLQIAMEFKAKDTQEEAAANYYGAYTTDFFITITGAREGSFTGDGCYLAGYYPSFNAWVKIPLDGFTIENGTTYPVITSAGFDFKYTDICASVQDFICGIYLSEAVLEANPDLKVELALGLSENMDAAQQSQFVEVDSYTYDVSDMLVTEDAEITVSEDVTVGTEVDPQTAEAAKQEIAANNYAKYSSGLDAQSNQTVVENAINDYVETLKQENKIEENTAFAAETVVSIELQEIAGAQEKLDSLTFDVEPQIIVKVDDTVVGTRKIKETFDQKIKFCLPLPSSFDAEYVDILHNGQKMNDGPVAVKGYGKNRYVEVESDTFSPFTVKAVENKIELVQATLELDSIVYLNVYATVEGFAGVDLEKNMGLLVWTGDESDYSEEEFTINNSNVTDYPGAKSNGSYYGVKTDGIPAKELGDEHYMRVYIKNVDGSYEYSSIVYYGPQTYAINKLKSDEATETLKKTMVAMLDYAAAAQVEFGYKTDDLANDIQVEGVDLDSYRTEYKEDMLEDLVEADATVVNGWNRDSENCPEVIGSLVLEGIITNKFSFKFTPAIMENVQTAKFLFWDADTYNQILQGNGTFSEENATITKDMVLDTDGYYKSGYDKTAVKQLGDSFYVCGVVTTDEGTYTSGVISYSGHKYIKNMLSKNSTEEDTQKLLKCLAVYSDAAKNYFSSL